MFIWQSESDSRDSFEFKSPLTPQNRSRSLRYLEDTDEDDGNIRKDENRSKKKTLNINKIFSYQMLCD